MADRPSPNTNSSSRLNIEPPPASSAGSTAPFTPRSSTFPGDMDSDDDFDAFEPTPISSPGGPRYDDLPPTYDEAQRQALDDARAGRAPLDPNDLEVHRMTLRDDNSSPEHGITPEIWEHRAPGYQQDNTTNASGLGMTVPVQHVQSSDHIPVGRTTSNSIPRKPVPAVDPPPFESSVPSPDPTTVLLSRALEFTRHEPDADARYAPRLTRSVAVPQSTVPLSLQGERRGSGRGRHGGRGRHERGRGGFSRAHGHHHVSGQWPESASSETANVDGDPGCAEPVQFMRAYAKTLHAHSIRPAEFMEFLDGLNALCLATNTSSDDLAHADVNASSPGSLVWNYINATNEAFFAPRGLRVSIQTLAKLIDAVQIPEQSGQRAGAVISATDETATPEQRAQALHPWIEKLEISVPGPTSQTLLLREMVEKLRRSSANPGTPERSIRDPEKARLAAAAAAEAGDPPHSVPEPYPDAATPGCPFTKHNGQPPWGSRGRGGHHGHRGRGWGVENGLNGSSHHHSGPGPHSGAGPSTRRGSGLGFPSIPPVPGLPRGATNSNDWGAYGERWGKWGEELGKRMEEWGNQFGKRAENWGENVGRRAETWGEGVGERFNGRSRSFGHTPNEPASTSSLDNLAGQETGVHRESSKEDANNNTEDHAKAHGKKADDDDDASSVCSSSSDSDSDSEPEYSNADEIFHNRVREINVAAEASRSKGKKTPDQIAQERAAAIEKAQSERTALERKIQHKREHHAQKKELKRRRKELKREHRRIKDELKGLRHGKGKDGKIAKKGKSREEREARREQRREHREQKRQLRDVKREARREWRDIKHEHRSARREGRDGVNAGTAAAAAAADQMVWIVVENLGV